jgi:hypothetical protein
LRECGEERLNQRVMKGIESYAFHGTQWFVVFFKSPYLRYRRVRLLLP